MLKRIVLFALFIIICIITNAQYASWMAGNWKSRNSNTTLQVTNIITETFTGTKTIAIYNNDTVIISISGGFTRAGLNIQDGSVVSKVPLNVQWNDCSTCTQKNKMSIHQDSLILTAVISGCGNGCDGEIVYYKLLYEYDDETQHYLVDRFGRPSDIIGFHPYRPKEKDTTVAAADVVMPEETNKQEAQKRQDSLNNIARIKQEQIENTARVAQQKKRDKEITDSLKIVQQKDKQHIKDSLANISKLEKIKLKTEDSLRDVQAKKRQQEIADSIHLAQQKEQQRIKDSLDNLARIKQQQINDAALLAQQKKRQKEINDSLQLVQQKEQQRINDSLGNVARLEKIRKHTEDSLRDAAAKKRQQEIADSLALANQQQQQRIKDSLQSVAAVNPAKAPLPPAADTAQPSANALTTRKDVLVGTYHITTPDILIELFDNGEIDGDRVSVYHNDTMIVNNQMLNKTAITLNVHADNSNRKHEFVLVAENLGSIPPNSALMRVTAGKQSYNLFVNTDLKTNARIVFYYDGN